MTTVGECRSSGCGRICVLSDSGKRRRDVVSDALRDNCRHSTMSIVPKLSAANARRVSSIFSNTGSRFAGEDAMT